MQRLQWTIFSIIAVLSIFVGFFAFEPQKAGSLFSKLAYWNILLCFFWFCGIVSRTYGRDLLNWFRLRPNQIVVLGVIAATLFLYTREGGGFKITFDEHTISNVAKSLHLERLAIFKESSISGIDDTSTIDKRPVLFPFLTATLHDVFGYSISNAFYLNCFLTSVFLLLLYLCCEKLLNARAGWIAIGITCCTPIFSQNSSGGGLEMINVVGILGCLFLGIRYSERPESISRFTSLIIGVTLFSHARYESPFLVAPVGLLVLFNWIRLKGIQISWTAVIAPLFFLPIAWQHVYANSRSEFKQLKDESSAFFSLGYVSDNLGHAANFLLTSSRFTTSNPIVSAIGILSLIILSVLICTRGKIILKTQQSLIAGCIFALSLIGEFFLILSFSWGQLDNPMVTRLGMPFFVLLIAVSAIALSLLISTNTKFRIPAYILLVVAFLFALPKYSHHLYTKNNMLLKRMQWVMDRHQELPRGNYLYLSYLSQEFELHGISNMHIKRALSRMGSLEMHKALKTYDEIYVVQFYGQKFNQGEIEEYVLPGNDLGPWFDLETIDEVSMLPMNFTRLSRVKSIRSSIDESKGEAILREELLSPQYQLINHISDEAYAEWRKSIP